MLISYSYSKFALFSPEFFALCGVVFVLSAAAVYTCDSAFTLSPKLRAFIRADRRLRYELNLFCAVFAALMLRDRFCGAVYSVISRRGVAGCLILSASKFSIELSC